MTKPDGKIKIIDYGGNAFLFLSRDVKISLSSRRRNLVYAGESFVKAAFLLHLLNIGMGQKATMSWASDIQHVNEKELSLVIDRVYKLLEGSLYSEVAKAVIKHNLISTTGWEKLSEALQAVSKEKIHVFEGADITETTFSGNSVEVRGYQNFLVTREGITIKNSSEKLWETEVKQKVVEKAFSQIETEVDSFLDIGCNSGLYSFLAREKFGARVLGVDYNKDYIDLCSRIVIHLGLEAISFATGVFSDLEEEYDCVLAMGLIHHLYHRTEEYGDLGNIMSKFASISKKFTIIEFPDENDPKASKWTNIAGRKLWSPTQKRVFKTLQLFL